MISKYWTGLKSNHPTKIKHRFREKPHRIIPLCNNYAFQNIFLKLFPKFIKHLDRATHTEYRKFTLDISADKTK